MICKKLTEAMGGEISFASEFGKGTEFTFTILDYSAVIVITEEATPLQRKISKETNEDLTASPQENNLTNLGKNHRVLVVDDEYLCGYILQSMLISLKFDAELVKNFILISIGHFWKRRHCKS